MEITWLGHANFRLRGREGVVVTDPALWKGAAGRTTADLVTVSHAHPGHNQAALVGGQPRVISGPGEYEVKGIVVTGVQTYHDAEKGKKRGKNTAYVIDLDDLVVCHLGDLGHLLSNDHVDQMRNVDVLMIPVGGGATIDAAQAVEVISLIEPRVIIPMHYRVGDLDRDLDPVDKFLREMGVADAPPQPRATLTRSNLPDATQVVVLEPRAA
jgi:L-ascorbate metabolism protein UlaG (beta-lactamase superfamily)